MSLSCKLSLIVSVTAVMKSVSFRAVMTAHLITSIQASRMRDSSMHVLAVSVSKSNTKDLTSGF